MVKHNFGSGGEGVFVGEAIEGAAAKVDDPAGWIVQDRHELNQMYARLLFTSDRPVRMDLGVFVNYDFYDGKLQYLRVAGVVARGSKLATGERDAGRRRDPGVLAAQRRSLTT